MSRPGRVLHATLDLLDRQILDRHAVPCGNVDDVELAVHPDGRVAVTALLSGPGILAYRLGHRRLGHWLQRADRRLHADDDQRDRCRIPMELAYEIGPAIRVAVDADDLGAHDLERWTRDQIIDRIPGDRHAPE
ncbi:MAG: hypothetical protein HZB15_09220 [Actinobacteria bacterium]|nr:hypothetical protein [Actinomycetota bacterium]